MQCTVAIPTYNRAQDLKSCLVAIAASSRLPDEVLIIDDGSTDPALLEECRVLLANTEMQYYKKEHPKEPRGLSESKNIALGLAKYPIVFFLDDDCVVSKVYFEKIMEVWDSQPDPLLLGIGGIISNNRKKHWLELWFNRLFGLNSKFAWDVTAVGFQVWDEAITEKQKGFYVHGGVSSYRTMPTRALGFQPFRGGRTALEDVEFCLRAKNHGYYFMIQPEATLQHFHSAASRESMFMLGTKEGHNRKQIYITNCPHSFPHHLWFVWSNIGWILRQLVQGKLRKAFGMCYGLFKV